MFHTCIYDCFKFRNDHRCLLLKTRWWSTRDKPSSRYTLRRYINSSASVERFLCRISEFKGALESSRVLLFSSIYLCAPLGFSFVPSYFKVRSHLMRAYANFDQIMSVLESRGKSTQKHHSCRKNRKKYKKYIIAIYLRVCKTFLVIHEMVIHGLSNLNSN